MGFFLGMESSGNVEFKAPSVPVSPHFSSFLSSFPDNIENWRQKGKTWPKQHYIYIASRL